MPNFGKNTNKLAHNKITAARINAIENVMPRNTSRTLHQAEIGAREIRSTKVREREALQADIRCEINRVQTITGR